MKGSCIILQSGGPTCAINSSLLGLIKEAKKHEEITQIFGSLNGIDGIINENIIDLNQEDEKELEKLKFTPSAILGSVRRCLPEDLEDEVYKQILQTFKKYDIRYFFLIGGNDSMDTVDKLSSYFKKSDYDCNIMGVPKTIDNDLVITDHTPGYGSAIKYIANTIAEIKEDTSCYAKGRVTIVEIMGRDAGWLTAGSKLASLVEKGPDLIYLPEVPFDLETFLNDVKTIYDREKKVLVAISEGIRNKKGQYVLHDYFYLKNNDVFGHMQLGGTASVLSDIVHEKLGLPVRAIELNLMQRCASHISSKADIDEAGKCGKKAVNLALKGKSGCMVIMQRKNGKITYSHKNIHKIANKVKEFPKEWIINGKDISEDYINYALPLIEGEYRYPLCHGLPDFAKLKKVKK